CTGLVLMLKRTLLRSVCLLLLSSLAVTSTTSAADAPSTPTTRRPNIIFVLADDLGIGELGCYGQQVIRTPRLDQMAAEGMKFRQFYAGATVCAPSRCVLMTGRHNGHARVRGNAGGDLSVQALQPEDV